MTLSTVILVGAMICFVVATVWKNPKVDLVAGGLALWVLSLLVNR